MKTLFQIAVDDIFKDKNFLETCIIGDDVFSCIASQLEEEGTYTEAGLMSDVNFSLSLKLPLQRIPKEGEKVVFRDERYKVSHVETDSANASVHVYLSSMSQGV